MIRRQFLPPEPTSQPHSAISEPANEQTTAKPSSPYRVVGNRQEARPQHQCVLTRPDAVLCSPFITATNSRTKKTLLLWLGPRVKMIDLLPPGYTAH